MWGNFQKPIIALTSSVILATSFLAASPADAKRARNYTPQSFRTVLRGLGYNVAVSNAPLTDAATRKAIRSFQQEYSLSADGIAGPQTQDKAALVISLLQRSLNLVVKPKPPLTVNQYYGPGTTAAVEAFQRRFKLQENGIATLEVRRKLDDEARRLLGKPDVAPVEESKPEPEAVPQQAPATPTATPEASPTPTPAPQATPTKPKTTPSPIGP